MIALELKITELQAQNEALIEKEGTALGGTLEKGLPGGNDQADASMLHIVEECLDAKVEASTAMVEASFNKKFSEALKHFEGFIIARKTRIDTGKDS